MIVIPWQSVPADSLDALLEEIVTRAVNDVGAVSDAEVREHMKRASQKFLIFYPNLTPIVYLTVKDSGVLLTARYLCDPRARRGTSEGIWKRILKEFDERDDIELARVQLAVEIRRELVAGVECRDHGGRPIPGTDANGLDQLLGRIEQRHRP